MTAEALRCWSDSLTVHPSVHVSPVDVESILTCFSDWVLVLFELFVRHHLASVGISDNIVVFNIGIDMFARHIVHSHTLHFNKFNYNLDNIINHINSDKYIDKSEVSSGRTGSLGVVAIYSCTLLKGHSNQVAILYLIFSGRTAAVCNVVSRVVDSALARCDI